MSKKRALPDDLIFFRHTTFSIFVKHQGTKKTNTRKKPYHPLDQSVSLTSFSNVKNNNISHRSLEIVDNSRWIATRFSSNENRSPHPPLPSNYPGRSRWRDKGPKARRKSKQRKTRSFDRVQVLPIKRGREQT